MLAYFSDHLRGKKPAKTIEDWLKYFGSGMLGALLGFLGSPTGEPQVKVNPSPEAPIKAPMKP